MTLPVDMAAVAERGLDHWARQAWWPVSPAEVRHLGITMLGSVHQAIAATADAGWQDCILADLRLGDYLVQRLLAIATTQRAQKADIAVRALGDGIDLYRPDYAQLTAAFHRQMSVLSRRGVTLLNTRRRWRGNSNLPFTRRFAATLLPPSTWDIGARFLLKEAFAEQTATERDFPNPFDWPRAQAYVPVPASLRQTLEDSLSSIAAGLPDVSLDTDERRGMIDLWCAHLSITRGMYDAAASYKFVPRSILWGSPGNVMFRALVFAMRRRGSQIVGFEHGDCPGWVAYPHIQVNEMRGCDAFICASPGQADAYLRLLQRSSFPVEPQLNLLSVDTGKYDRWRASAPPRRPIRRVLLAGFPGHAKNYLYDWTGHALVRLPAELQVARALRSAGYQVVYKPHPDTAARMAPLMRDHVDEVNLGSFEAAVDAVDAAVYLYPFSTTFPYVLLRNVPVLLVDVAGRDWLPEIIEPLRKRCAVVTATLSQNNRILLDDGQIVEGMGAAADLADTSFVETFYTPATAAA